MMKHAEPLARLQVQLGTQARRTLDTGEQWARNDDRIPMITEKSGVVVESPIEGDSNIVLVIFRWHPPGRPEAMQYGARLIDANNGDTLEMYDSLTGQELAPAFDRALAIAERAG